MKLKNIQMESMINSLKPFLSQRNKIGYVAARNTRLLLSETTEYFAVKNDLIRRYGEPDIDENGNIGTTVTVKIGSDGYKNFEREILQYTDIEHDVPVMKLKYKDVIDVLSGEEILSIDWMLEDDAEG